MGKLKFQPFFNFGSGCFVPSGNPSWSDPESFPLSGMRRLLYQNIPQILIQNVLAFFILQDGIKEKVHMDGACVLLIAFPAFFRKIGGEAIVGGQDGGPFFSAGKLQEFKGIFRIAAAGINRQVGVAPHGGPRFHASDRGSGAASQRQLTVPEASRF